MPEDEQRKPPPNRAAPAWLVWVTMAVALALVFWRFSPPAPRPADAAPTVFSAERALVRLKIVLGDQRPHPVGSAENDAVRERLLSQLRALGYRPTVQEAFSCGRYGRCAPVFNVLAMLAGDDEAVLLAAHYDSVAAGPGASDDGSGVAVLLEAARALKQGPAPRHTVLLLFTDGEEAGLLGAEAFMTEHRLARRVRVAINVEARGTRGPSLMFETAGATAELAEHLAVLERPVTSSLFSAVYERMPNDTDLTVFRDHGVAGYNLAFIGGVEHYHSARDDLAHLDLGSLQHQGDNALALTVALADAPLDGLQRGAHAVWFDLLAFGVVRWPLGASLPLALTALTALLALAWVVRRRERQLLVGILASAGSLLAALLLAVAIGFGLMLLLGSGAPRFTGAALSGSMALMCVAAALPGLWLGRRLARTRGPWGRLLGVWLVCALAGVALALVLPQGCHLFVAPALVVAVTGLLAASRRQSAAMLVAAICGTLCAAALWLQLVLALGDALGLLAHPGMTAAIALWVASAWALHCRPGRLQA